MKKNVAMICFMPKFAAQYQKDVKTMKRILITLVTFLALLAGAPIAQAADWFNVMSSNGETIALNPDITVADNGASYLVWVRNSFDVPETRAEYSSERG